MGVLRRPSSPRVSQRTSARARTTSSAPRSGPRRLKYNGDDPWKTPKAFGDAFRAKHAGLARSFHTRSPSRPWPSSPTRRRSKARHDRADEGARRASRDRHDDVLRQDQVRRPRREHLQADGRRAVTSRTATKYTVWPQDRRREGDRCTPCRRGTKVDRVRQSAVGQQVRAAGSRTVNRRLTTVARLSPMSGAEFGQIAVNALMLSGILALVALGFSPVWGIMNIVNLSHGAFIVIGRLPDVLDAPVLARGSVPLDPRFDDRAFLPRVRRSSGAHQPGDSRAAPRDVPPDVRPGDPDRQPAQLLLQGGHAIGPDALQRDRVHPRSGPRSLHPAGGPRGLDRPRPPPRARS